MSNIRAIDMLHLDDVFQMHDGYVLGFSDRTFAQFFAEELNLDIDDPTWARNGRSKAKRLRTFLQSADKRLVVRCLNALWEYREAARERSGHEDKIKNAHGRLLDIINRLNGDKPLDTPTQTPGLAIERAKLAFLRSDLLVLSTLEPQPRGYAFEKFLKELFDAHGLQAREPFRLRGEQIDGSFVFDKEIYLLEAKWQGGVCDIGQLHAFHGKLEQKAAWTRGLFISHAGFSEDGLHAFGRGKRLICMDGLDLNDTLEREIPLNHALERKVRRAGETGIAFVRVRDLFI
jgi:hypothetical protein